jgi:phosphoribosylglycinamide formyltransferase-1
LPLAGGASPARYPIAVLLSGRGTNLMAIHAAIQAGTLAARIVAVGSNRPEAPGVAWARAQGLPVGVFSRADHPTRVAAQEALLAWLEARQPALVVLAGWDQVLIPAVVATYAGRLLNIHPSLLPAFAGSMHAVEEALAHGAKVTGCTVHYVTDDVDGGPIVLQAPVPILDDDTPATLLARIHEQEYRLLPEAIALHAAGRLHLDGRRVRIRPA